MGNDGGTIARGQDLRAIYALGEVKNEKLDDSEKSRWNTCSLSSQPLALDTTVSDYKGNLYLKEKVVELLIEKKLGENGTTLPFLKSLDDLTELTISWNENGHVICPVTSVLKTSQSNFAYLRPCGCVVSYKILAELRKHYKVKEGEQEGKECDCPLCGKPFMFNYDVVIINPLSKEDEEFNQRNYGYLTETLGLSHSKKNLKKRKREKKGKGKEKTLEKKQGTEKEKEMEKDAMENIEGDTPPTKKPKLR